MPDMSKLTKKERKAIKSAEYKAAQPFKTPETEGGFARALSNSSDKVMLQEIYPIDTACPSPMTIFMYKTAPILC